MSAINAFLLGAVAMGSLAAALFFLRFWRLTRDRFFLLFSIAFAIDAADRAALASIAFSSEHEPLFYLIRLLVYALILVAIIDKNRANREDR